MKALFMENEHENNVELVYKDFDTSSLKGNLEFFNIKIGRHNLEQYKDKIKDAEVVFSTWGMPDLNETELDKYLPGLKCVFYAAGSVQYFARPFLLRGVRVFSAWAANAVPVAEYAVSQIILANKGYFQAIMKTQADRTEVNRFCDSFRGNYGCNVGIIGAGMIGKLVINMLKGYKLNILVFDPFLPDALAQELGVQKCSLEYLFANCQTISNHLANNKETVGILNKKLFDLMCDNATFINTGRGAQVIEADLVQALNEEPDRTALLDVTYLEPPLEGHAFYSMDNVFLTPHIAGSKSDEVKRMADYMAEEFQRYMNGSPARYEVTLDMLGTMA